MVGLAKRLLRSVVGLLAKGFFLGIVQTKRGALVKAIQVVSLPAIVATIAAVLVATIGRARALFVERVVG